MNDFNYFTFASTSFPHICEAAGRGIWAFRYHDNNAHDKRCRTKAERYVRIGDFVYFYCSDPEYKGIAAIARIKGRPSSEVYGGPLWESGNWHLVVPLEFIVRPDEQRILSPELISEMSGGLSINDALAPQSTRSYVPLQQIGHDFFMRAWWWFEQS